MWPGLESQAHLFQFINGIEIEIVVEIIKRTKINEKEAGMSPFLNFLKRTKINKKEAGVAQLKKKYLISYSRKFKEKISVLKNIRLYF